eukprot:SAG31_NODE_3818_length_3853_cov_10.567395_3_plen_55_part_00
MCTIAVHALFLFIYGVYMTANAPSCQRDPACATGGAGAMRISRTILKFGTPTPP